MGSETPYPDEFEKETITIELVDDADSEEVLKLLKTFFFKVNLPILHILYKDVHSNGKATENVLFIRQQINPIWGRK